MFQDDLPERAVDGSIELFGRTFGTPVGQAVLELLVKQTIERRARPGSMTNEELWFLEGQRDLVTNIIQKVRKWQG